MTAQRRATAAPVRQDVYLSVWGETDAGGLASARKFLSDFLPHRHHVEIPDLASRAIMPGAYRIRDVDWGDMPSGMPHLLSRLGLNLLWLTAPVGFEPRGSHVSHAGLGLRYEVRCNPVWTGCDLAISRRGPCPEGHRLPEILLELGLLLDVREEMSAHEAFRSDRALYLASRAASVEALERALLVARSEAGGLAFPNNDQSYSEARCPVAAPDFS